MVRRDEDGYYILVDRKANMIITGGENVYPSEVENVVGSHPAVKDVAVIGVPDKKWGEAIKAIVILHEGHKEPRPWPKKSSIFARGKLPDSKNPRPSISSPMPRCREPGPQDPAPDLEGKIREME